MGGVWRGGLCGWAEWLPDVVCAKGLCGGAGGMGKALILRLPKQCGCDTVLEEQVSGVVEQEPWFEGIGLAR